MNGHCLNKNNEVRGQEIMSMIRVDDLDLLDHPSFILTTKLKVTAQLLNTEYDTLRDPP